MSFRGRKRAVKRSAKTRLRSCFSLWGESDCDVLKTQLYIWFPCAFRRPRLDVLQQAIVDIATHVVSKVNLTTIMTPNTELTGSHDQRTLHRGEIRASMKGKNVEFVSGIVPVSQKQGSSTCTSLSVCETQIEEKLENKIHESKLETEADVLSHSFESSNTSSHPEREPTSHLPSSKLPFHNGKESKVLREMYDKKIFHVPAWFMRLATSETALQLVPFSLDGSSIQSEELKELSWTTGRLRLEVLHLNTPGRKSVHFAIAEECKRDCRPTAKTPLQEKEEKGELRTVSEYNDNLVEPSIEPLSASDESQVNALFEEERKLSFPYRWRWLKEGSGRRRNQSFSSILRRRLTQIGRGWRSTRRNHATLALEPRKSVQSRVSGSQLQQSYPSYNKVENVASLKKKNKRLSGRDNANVSKNNSNGTHRNCMDNHLRRKSIQVQTSSDEADSLKNNQKILFTKAKVEEERHGTEQQFFSNISLNMDSPSKSVTDKVIQPCSCLRKTDICTNQMRHYISIDTEKQRERMESKPALMQKKGHSIRQDYTQDKSNSSNAGDMTHLEDDKALIDDLSKEQKVCSATGVISTVHIQTIPLIDLLEKGVSRRKTIRARKALTNAKRNWRSRKGSCRLSRYFPANECSSLILGEPGKERAKKILPAPYVQKSELDHFPLPTFLQASEPQGQEDQRSVDKSDHLDWVVESLADFVRRQWKSDACSHVMKSQRFKDHSSDNVKRKKCEKIVTISENPLIPQTVNSPKYFRTHNQKIESLLNKDQFLPDSTQSQNAADASNFEDDIQNRNKYPTNFLISTNNTTQSSENNGIQTRIGLTTDESPPQSTKISVYVQDLQNRRLKRVSHQLKQHGPLQKNVQLRRFLQKSHAVSSIRSPISETPRLSFQNNNDTPPPVEEESRTPLQDNVMNEVILSDHRASGVIAQTAPHSDYTENDRQSKMQSVPDNGEQYENQSVRFRSQQDSQTAPHSNVTDNVGQSKNQSIRSVETRAVPNNGGQSQRPSSTSMPMNPNPNIIPQGTNKSQTYAGQQANTQTDAQRASLMFQSIMNALDILISREQVGGNVVDNNTLQESDIRPQVSNWSTEVLPRQTLCRTDTSNFESVRTVKRDTQHEVPAPSPKRETYTYSPLQPRPFSRNRGSSYPMNQDKSDTWRNSRRTDPCRPYFSDTKGDPCRNQLSTPCDGLRIMRPQGKTSVRECSRSPLQKSPDMRETLPSRLFYPTCTNGENAETPGKDRQFTEAEACALAYIKHACNLGPPTCFEVAHKSMGCHREADKYMSRCGVKKSELVEVDNQLKEPDSKEVIECPCVLKCQVPMSPVEKCFCMPQTNPSVKVCCDKARCIASHGGCTKTKCSCCNLGSSSKAVQVDVKKRNAPNCKKSVSVCVQRVKTKPICTTSVQTCPCLCNTMTNFKDGQARMKTVPEPNTNICCTASNACYRCRANAEVCGKSTMNRKRLRGIQAQREDDDTCASTVASCVTLHGEECRVKIMHNKKCQVGQPIICQNIGTKVGSSLTCSKVCSCKPCEARSKCIVCKASKGMPSGLAARVEACVESTPCISQESTFGPPPMESASDCELPYGASLFLKNVERRKAMGNCCKQECACLRRGYCVKKSTSGKMCPQCEPGCRRKNVCTDHKSQHCCQGRTEEVCCDDLDGDTSVSPVMRIHYKSRRLPAKKPDCTSSTSWSDVVSPNAILKDKISNLIEQSKEVTKQVQKMKGTIYKNNCGRRPYKAIHCQDDSNENKTHENKNANAKELQDEKRASAEFMFFGRNPKWKSSYSSNNFCANEITKPVDYHAYSSACNDNELNLLHTAEKLQVKLNLDPTRSFLLSPSEEICLCVKSCSQIDRRSIHLDLNNSNENEGDLEKKEIKETSGGAAVCLQDSKHPNKFLERNQRRYVGHWFHRIISPRGLRSQKKFATAPNKKKELEHPSMTGAGDRINPNQRQSNIKKPSTISTLFQSHKKRSNTTEDKRMLFMANRHCEKHADMLHSLKTRSKALHLVEEKQETEDSNASSHGIEELPFDHFSDGTESGHSALKENEKNLGTEKHRNVEAKAKGKTPKTNKIQPTNQLSVDIRTKTHVIPWANSSKSSVVSSDKEMAATVKPNKDTPRRKKYVYRQPGTVYDSNSVKRLDDEEGRSSSAQNGLNEKRTAGPRSKDSFTDKNLLTPSSYNVPQRNSSSVISASYTITPRINRMQQLDVDKNGLTEVRKVRNSYFKPFCMKSSLTFRDLEEKQQRNMREGLQHTIIDWWNSPDCLKERTALASNAISKATKNGGEEEQETKILKSKRGIIYKQDGAHLKSSVICEYAAHEDQSASLRKRRGIMLKGRSIMSTTSCANTTTSNNLPLCPDRAYDPTSDVQGSTVQDVTEIEDQSFFIEPVLSDALSVSGVTDEASLQLKSSSTVSDMKVKKTVQKNAETSWFARHLGTAEVVEANELRVVLEGAYVIPSASWKAGKLSQSTTSSGQTNSERGLDEKLYSKDQNSSSVFSDADDSQHEALGTFGLKSLPFRLVLFKSCQDGGPVAVHGTYMRKLISEEGAIKWTIKA